MVNSNCTYYYKHQTVKCVMWLLYSVWLRCICKVVLEFDGWWCIVIQKL